MSVKIEFLGKAQAVTSLSNAGFSAAQIVATGVVNSKGAVYSGIKRAIEKEVPVKVLAQQEIAAIATKVGEPNGAVQIGKKVFLVI
jgi:hypothetical protein